MSYFTNYRNAEWDAFAAKTAADEAAWADRLGYTQPEVALPEGHNCYVCDEPYAAGVESCGVCYFPVGLGLKKAVPEQLTFTLPGNLYLNDMLKQAYPQGEIAAWYTSSGTQTVTAINARTGTITIAYDTGGVSQTKEKSSSKKKRK